MISIIPHFFPSMKDKKNNTGTDNTGDRNSGNRNSGNGNSGNGNSGNGNSGNRNSGYGNSGYGNSGYGNSGYGNSGNGNSGDWNSGYGNSGYGNSGYGNSGYGNSGYGNSGDWNSGYGNSGMFNTDEPYMRAFNRETKIKRSDFVCSSAYPDFSEMNPCVWIESSMMTDKEKKDYPSHETTGGYVKTLSYKEAWAVWKRKCSKENWLKVVNLPNFDAAIFEEITGLKVEDNSEAKQKAAELRKKADELLESAKALESSL